MGSETQPNSGAAVQHVQALDSILRIEKMEGKEGREEERERQGVQMAKVLPKEGWAPMGRL